MFGQPIYFFLRLILQLIFSRTMKKLFNRSRHFAAFLMGLLLAIPAMAQPPAGAVAAKPNIIYYAGGKCDFYDVNSNLLLSVDAAEAGWSATPAKAAWVVVTPSSGGYYEFPNYSSNAPTCSTREYLQPFWNSDTIFNELVLLSGVNSTANLMFKPKQIVKVTNYDFSKTFTANTDYTVSGKTITQKSSAVSNTYVVKGGVKGNGQSNGLMNTNPTSWTCVTYIPDRGDWGAKTIFGYKGDLLPKTMSKLKNKQALVIQAYGMSITAGLNVSGFAGDDKNFKPTKPYMHSYVDLLGEGLLAKFGGNITMINGSCGGKTVAWIDQYCKSMVNPNNPDLVILDMGMNDIWGTSNASFKASMQSCIDKIKKDCPNAEFILIGNMLPDVNSQGSPSNGDALMYGFLSQLKSLEASGIAVMDMTTMSDTVYRRKGAKHCTANSLHPNDYLARWYAQGLLEVFNDGSSPSPNSGKTYYVNTTGNNTDGLTLATAWTSLSKVNAQVFQPGDRVLFEGGKTFTGNIELDALDGNIALKPVVFSTYGLGRATINTTVTNKCGFKATNLQGVHVRNLVFKGPGNGTQKDIDGILFFTDKPSGYLSNIALTNVEVFGFGYCGMRFYSSWSATVKAGYRGVRIDSCSVHDCRENGIVSFAYDDQTTNFYHHRDFQIRNTEVYNITGYAAGSHKGSGIVLSQIDYSVIERCVAYNTGTLNSACGGPGGIWVWSADNVTIQYCESHHNSSGSSTGCDGLGFDLDGGVTNSIVQYCYSHDNDGAGYLLGNFTGARAWGSNTVRYNISINDARTNNSAVTLFTAPNTTWNGLNFYNNTVYVSGSTKNKYTTFGAFQMTDYGTNMSGVKCYNNIFQVSGSGSAAPLSLVHVPATFLPQNPVFTGNLYWSSGGTFKITYGNSYSSLSAFRATGNEKLNGNGLGVEADPLLTGTSNAAALLYPKENNSLNQFQLVSNSPAKDAGLDLFKEMGLTVGARDFWGSSIPAGTKFDIGAHEFGGVVSSVTDVPKKTYFRIQSNPITNGVLDVELDFSNQKGNKFLLMDITGKTIYLEQNCNHINDNKMSMDVSCLPSGMYWLTLTVDGCRMQTAQVVIYQ